MPKGSFNACSHELLDEVSIIPTSCRVAESASIGWLAEAKSEIYTMVKLW